MVFNSRTQHKDMIDIKEQHRDAIYGILRDTLLKRLIFFPSQGGVVWYLCCYKRIHSKRGIILSLGIWLGVIFTSLYTHTHTHTACLLHAPSSVCIFLISLRKNICTPTVTVLLHVCVCTLPVYVHGIPVMIASHLGFGLVVCLTSCIEVK